MPRLGTLAIMLGGGLAAVVVMRCTRGSGGLLGILAALASRGLGVAILPEFVALAHPELHAIAVTRPAMRGRLALAWRSGGPISPAARALIARARSVLANSAVEGQPAA
jgi:DNA-binding transcriptional LysR family regulator